MGNIIDDVMGHITPIDKKEVDEFKLLVSEEAFLTENRDKITFSEGFPPELAGAISGLGAGWDARSTRSTPRPARALERSIQFDATARPWTARWITFRSICVFIS